MDISPENEIQRLQKALDRANAEFVEFVSMAGHNLRDSLRDVAANSQLMTEAYAGRLDSDAGIFLGRIQDGAAKMQSLLTDIVDYWSASTGACVASRTDMEAVLFQALISVDKQLTERCAMATHDPMPLVWGDFETLTKILRHLIRNAVEYCDTPSPHVHISCRRDGAEWIFSVHDDGPGIEPEFQGHLFSAFKRLHGKEYPGNGLGLAFCKRAIERCAGRMWVESTPGAGSTFYFTAEAAD